jgi:hypothetical protein
MNGQWLGYGRDFDINDGPWTLELVTADTSPARSPSTTGPPGIRLADVPVLLTVLLDGKESDGYRMDMSERAGCRLGCSGAIG